MVGVNILKYDRLIDTKYYTAKVKFEIVPTNMLDEDTLEALGGKMEAFIYYYT
jgi:hypothetical protein